MAQSYFVVARVFVLFRRLVVAETSGVLRHLAFFEELGKIDETDPNWRPVRAGLVVMRLVDSWIADGATPSRVDSWGVSAVREAVAELSASKPLRRILTSIVDVIVSATSIDLHALSPRLMAYGQALEYDSKLSLASDVYRTIVAHAHPVDDADLVVSAHSQLAFCLRNLGDLDGSGEAYDECGRVAGAAGDLMGVLRAQVGHAKVAIARGNLPRAESILDDAIVSADSAGLVDIRSRALHDRAQVAGLRGQYERSIQFAYQALESTRTQRERDRILNDIAVSFMYLGLHDAARDAYLVLAATASEQYIRWLSELNLLEIAAQQGNELQFDRYRRDLANADFTPELRVTYFLHVGRGYHNLGQSNAGIDYLERAVETASHYKLNQLLFEAENALSDAQRAAAHTQRRDSYTASPEVENVIDVIRGMKELAGIS
jgi:tetratricopeptide (TPR) repeat protein